MDYLYKVFRKLEYSDYEKEYHNRIHFPTTVKLDLTIKPINNKNEFQLYYLPNQKIQKLIADIYQNDKTIEYYNNNLPGVAKQKFILESIADELQNTNELRGFVVHVKKS